MSHLLINYYEAASVILFGIGFMNLLLQNNLIKKFIGLNIMDTAVYLFLAAKGYITGRVAPILSNSIIDADYYINPVPAGLVLTGIVVSVSITAFSLALVQRLYKHYGTLNMDEIMQLSREREGELMEHVNWIHNIPFFSIFLAMFCGIITPLIKNGKTAHKVHALMVLIVAIMSGNSAGECDNHRGILHIHDGTFSRALGQRIACRPAGSHDGTDLQRGYAADNHRRSGIYLP